MSRAMARVSAANDRRRRIVIAAVLAVAVAAAVPVMNRGSASAATATIKEDCTRGAPALRSCDFRESGFTPGVELEPERISPTVENCNGSADIRETFRYSISINRTITLEKGYEVSVTSSPMTSSLGALALVHTHAEYRLTTDGRTVGGAEWLSGLVRAGHRGFFMFAPLAGRSVGFLDALYSQKVDGETQHYFPAKDSSQVMVDFPELLQDGRPDGYLFLRNVRCDARYGPQASTAGLSGLSDLEETARFNEIPQFTDVLVDY